MNASFWFHDITPTVRVLSAKDAVVRIDVNRADYPYLVLPDGKLGLTVTWVTRRDGEWVWHMDVKEVGQVLVIEAA